MEMMEGVSHCSLNLEETNVFPREMKERLRNIAAITPEIASGLDNNYPVVGCAPHVTPKILIHKKDVMQLLEFMNIALQNRDATDLLEDEEVELLYTILEIRTLF